MGVLGKFSSHAKVVFPEFPEYYFRVTGKFMYIAARARVFVCEYMNLIGEK